jgi:hypothetical protein
VFSTVFLSGSDGVSSANCIYWTLITGNYEEL